jgi:hypothetical protein
LSKFDDFLGYHPRRRIIGQFHPEFPAYRFELPAQELDPREMVLAKAVPDSRCSRSRKRMMLGSVIVN